MKSTHNKRLQHYLGLIGLFILPLCIFVYPVYNTNPLQLIFVHPVLGILIPMLIIASVMAIFNMLFRWIPKLGSVVRNSRTKTALYYILTMVFAVTFLVVLYLITNRIQNIFIDVSFDQRFQVSPETQELLHQVSEKHKKIIVTIADFSAYDSIYSQLQQIAENRGSDAEAKTYTQHGYHIKAVKQMLSNYQDHGDVTVQYTGHASTVQLFSMGFNKRRFQPTDYGSVLVSLVDDATPNDLTFLSNTETKETPSRVVYLDEMAIYKPAATSFGGTNKEFKGYAIEERINNAIKTLLSGTEEVLKPSIYFLQGHRELYYNQDMQFIRDELSKHYTIKSIEMEYIMDTGNPTGAAAPKDGSSTSTANPAPSRYRIPSECTVLVIAAPRLPLLPAHKEAILDFLARGNHIILFMGSLIRYHEEQKGFMVDPQDFAVYDSLNEILLDYGIQLEKSWILEQVLGTKEPQAQFRIRYQPHTITNPLINSTDFEMVATGAANIRPMQNVPNNVSHDVLMTTSNQAQKMDLGNAVDEISFKQAMGSPMSGTYILGMLVTKTLQDTVTSDRYTPAKPKKELEISIQLFEKGKSNPGKQAKSDNETKSKPIETATQTSPRNQAQEFASGDTSTSPISKILVLTMGDSFVDPFLNQPYVDPVPAQSFFYNAISYIMGKEEEVSIETRSFATPEASVSFYDLAGFFSFAVILVVGIIGIVGFTFVWLRNRRNA